MQVLIQLILGGASQSALLTGFQVLPGCWASVWFPLKYRAPALSTAGIHTSHRQLLLPEPLPSHTSLRFVCAGAHRACGGQKMALGSP